MNVAGVLLVLSALSISGSGPLEAVRSSSGARFAIAFPEEDCNCPSTWSINRNISSTYLTIIGPAPAAYVDGICDTIEACEDEPNVVDCTYETFTLAYTKPVGCTTADIDVNGNFLVGAPFNVGIGGETQACGEMASKADVYELICVSSTPQVTHDKVTISWFCHGCDSGGN